jgi:hypothetical protein
VDETGRLAGLITIKDIDKTLRFPTPAAMKKAVAGRRRSRNSRPKRASKRDQSRVECSS